MEVSVSPDGFGAEIRGISTSQPLSDDELAALHDALVSHRAIVVHDLDEDVGWLCRLGRHFGPLVPHILDQYHHPETDEVSIIARNMDSPESRTTATPAGSFWHTDLTYKSEPSDAIFLYATHLPTQGGDTLVTDLAAAYADLSKATKERIENLTATHRFGWNTGGGTPKLTDSQENAHPDVMHSVVRGHPMTGEKVLYVNPGYTMCINELPRIEGDALLDALFAHSLNEKYQHRHHWEKGMLLGLDNRATMHKAVNDYDEPRRMLRMIVGHTG